MKPARNKNKKAESKPETIKNNGNPVCTMGITVNGEQLGDVKILLRADVVPKTAENFRYRAIKIEK